MHLFFCYTIIVSLHYTIQKALIGIFVIDISPQGLKFLFVKIIVKRIVPDYIIQNTFINDSLNKLVHTCLNVLVFLGNRCKRVILNVCSVFIGNIISCISTSLSIVRTPSSVVGDMISVTALGIMQ